MFTRFWDMCSGGDKKEKWDPIYIEAPNEEAQIIFYNKFGHNPNRVSCTCCGPDYVIDEFPTLEEATAYHGKDSKSSRIIYNEEIKPDERTGELPEQGYVWR